MWLGTTLYLPDSRRLIRARRGDDDAADGTSGKVFQRWRVRSEKLGNIFLQISPRTLKASKALSQSLCFPSHWGRTGFPFTQACVVCLGRTSATSQGRWLGPEHWSFRQEAPQGEPSSGGEQEHPFCLACVHASAILLRGRYFLKGFDPGLSALLG